MSDAPVLDLQGAVVKLARNQRLVWNGVMHQVRRRLPDGDRFVMEAVEGGESFTRTYGWLDDEWTEGRLRILPTDWDQLSRATQDVLTSDMDGLTDGQRRIARYRQPYSEALENYRKGRTEPGRTLAELFAEIADRRNATRAPCDHEAPPKRTQLYEFTARWIAADMDVRALAPNHQARGNRTPRYEDDLVDIIDETVEEIWLTPVARTKAALFVACKTRVQTLNAEAGRPGAELPAPVTLPTRKMVEYRADRIERFDRDYYRKDPIKARDEWTGTKLGPVASRVNERWELDSTVLDMHVVDGKTRARLGRPTLTVIIDVATRLVVGWALTFEGESTLQVMSALRHAIKPKRHGHLGLRCPNPGRGKPEGLWVDNAMAHGSKSLNDAAFRLRFTPYLLPPGRPRMKGKIERWFRSLGIGLIHNLPGTTKSNPKDKGDYDAEEEAIFTLEEIEWLLTYWICDVYNAREHRATRRSPLGLWREMANEYPPVMPAHVDDLDVLLGRVDGRTVTRKGIEWEGLLFDCPSLQLLRNRPNFDPHDVTIRVDESDIEAVRVLDPDTGRYLPVPCTNKAYATGKTLHQHLVTIRHAKDKADEDRALSEHDFEIAWGEIVLAGELLMETKGRRKTLNRLGRLFALGVDRRPTATPARHPEDDVFDDLPATGPVEAVAAASSLRPPEVDERPTRPLRPADIAQRAGERRRSRRAGKGGSGPSGRAPATTPVDGGSTTGPPTRGRALPSTAPLTPMEVDYD